MKLSLITVNLNNLDGLKRTARSVLSQTFDDFEWIVIDGGSIDGSKEYIESLSKHISFWCSEKDSGIYNAMNKGVNHAKGEYLLFLNSGDLLCGKSVLKEVFSTDRKGDILYGDLVICDGKKVIEKRRYDDNLTFKYLVRMSIGHPSSFIKASLLREHPYNENYRIVSDKEFFIRQALVGASFIHIPHFISRFNINGISSTETAFTLAENAAMIKAVVPPGTMESPKLSVIIPCYNQGLFLPEALDSVLSQTFQDWECIIVNDGSTDNTAEIAEEYCLKDIRFKLVNQENKGLSAARNTGIRNSSGEFILPLDSDDIIHKDYARLAIERFLKQPETKAVYCKAKLFGEVNSKWKLPEFKWDRFIFSNCIFCSCFFRRKDYDSAGGYNEKMKLGFEDWDFLLRLIGKEDCVYRIPKYLFFYRIKKSSMTTSHTHPNKYKVANEILDNHIELYRDYLLSLMEILR